MAKNEPCSICEEYIEGVMCDKDKCPVAIMKAEIERLQKAIKVQDVMIEQQENEYKTAKAEIERLQTMHSEMCIGMKVLKKKAIKEFAERLKELVVYDTIRNYEITNGRTYELSEMVREDIDDLVEEMVGD